MKVTIDVKDYERLVGIEHGILDALRLNRDDWVLAGMDVDQGDVPRSEMKKTARL